MSSFDSFRIVCWQMLWFNRDRNENLHPDYFNCLRCYRKEKDLKARPIQCPTCPLTEKLQFYKAEMTRLIKESLGKFPKDYTLAALMDLYGQVSSILDRNRNQISRAWNKRTARLASILLSERHHMRAVDDWEYRQRIRQK
jgi:hypothetical protein